MIKFIIVFFIYPTFATKPDVSYLITPLTTAAHKGDLKAVKTLIKEGADVNKFYPLHYAVNTGKMSFVSFNFRTGIPSSNTKISNSRLNTYLKIIKFLIENGADVNATNKNGETALFKARNLEVAKILIKQGADVNAKDKYGETPLFKAPNLEIANLLIKNGSDVNAINNTGDTPCDIVYLQEIKSFIQEKNGFCRNLTYLHRAVMGKNKTAVNHSMTENSGFIKLLLRAKKRVINARENKDGNTALHFAEDLEIAKILIKNGANINTINNKGETPFDTIKSEHVKRFIQENGGRSGHDL